MEAPLNELLTTVNETFANLLEMLLLLTVVDRYMH